MKKLFPITISFALVCASAQAGDISDAFVEKTLGISGVKHTTKTQSKHGMTFSDVEYKDAKGQSLITVRHGSIDQYNMWKQTAGPDAIPVSGLGTDAFRYKTLKAVCAKSESTAVCVTPDFLTKTPTITDAHLQTLVNAAL